MAKILLYCVLDKQGGIETHIQSLSRVLRANGADVTVAAKWVKDPERYETYFGSLGIRLVYPKLAQLVSNSKLPRMFRKLLSNVLGEMTFRQKLKSRDYDLVSINASGAFGTRFHRCVKPGGRITYHEHQTSSYLEGTDNWYTSLLKGMDFLTVNSTQNANQLSEQMRDAVPIYVLPALAGVSGNELPTRSGEAVPRLRVAFIGNISATEKGAAKLIRIWKNYRIEDMDLTFYGPNAHVLEGVEDLPNVSLAGPFLPKELSNVFSKIDLLVHPADSESLGLVLIEAMAHGVPFLATSVGGIIDIARDNPNVLTVENSEEAIYEGLLNMQRRIKLGEISSHGLQEQYLRLWSEEALGSRWVQTYLVS